MTSYDRDGQNGHGRATSLGRYGGMVGIVVAIVGTLLVGSVPLAGILMLMGGRDMGPLPTIPPNKGSIFIPTMGIDSVMNRFNSD